MTDFGVCLMCENDIGPYLMFKENEPFVDKYLSEEYKKVIESYKEKISYYSFFEKNYVSIIICHLLILCLVISQN